MKHIMGAFFYEISGILGVIAWMSSWPRDYNSVRNIDDLTMRVHRLRTLVESLNVAIN